MIKNIDLRSMYSEEQKFINFNKESHVISALYTMLLPEFDSEKIRYCLITLFPHDNFPIKDNIKGFADCYLLFDFDKYFSLSDADRKMMQLEAIQQGILSIASEHGWDTQPFKAAYKACIDANLILKTQIKKRKISPSKKYYLSLWTYGDLRDFKITWTISNRKEELIKQGILFEDSSFIAMGDKINFHWINDESFIVESNYKEIITDTWKVDLNQPA